MTRYQTKIAIIDYGMGNIASVERALNTATNGMAKISRASTPEEIYSADKVVFPGQGAVGECLNSLKENNLIEPLLDAIKNKPFLGICLGLQIFLTNSEEKKGVNCLNIIEGSVCHFPKDQSLNIPHLGWNHVSVSDDNYFMVGIPPEKRYFYFIHSFYARIAENSKIWVTGITDYFLKFPSFLSKDNVALTQFHPEKSGKNGIIFTERFISWKP